MTEGQDPLLHAFTPATYGSLGVYTYSDSWTDALCQPCNLSLSRVTHLHICTSTPRCVHWMQVIDALGVTNADLVSIWMALTWQEGPAQWQSDLVTSYFPSMPAIDPGAPASNPGVSAATGHSVALVMHASAALHGLPATAQPGSAKVLSCIRALASVIDLMSALAKLPDFLTQTSQMDLKIVGTALATCTPAVHGYVIKKGRELLSLIEVHEADLVQRAQDTEHQRRQALVLSMLNAWKVCH